MRRGAELFDAGRYFEAHEAWEAGWLACERGQAASNLLQGLVQCAAACLKLQQGRLNGARSLVDKGTRLVESALLDACPHDESTALVLFVQRIRVLFAKDMPLPIEVPKLLFDDGSGMGHHHE